MRHGIDLTFDRRVLLYPLQEVRRHLVDIDLRKVERLVDVVFELGRIDPVVARLREVIARAAGGP
ncbi:hypothetical protein D3C72_2260580 [compost metagenome]